ncbi:MAG: DNA mobilization endonuclease VirD1/MobC family subunit [Pseudomonadota bacterium]
MRADSALEIPQLEMKITQLGGRPPKPDPKAYTVVSVRLREAEYLSFMEQIRPFGVSGNLAMRIAARRISGFLELDADVRNSMQSITKSIGDISSSLNIIAEKADTDLDALKDLRKAFGEEFVRLDNQLQALLNVSKRRQDGQQLLVEASR